jgi:dipeptidyl aminopeptidase/acylaminoacyl peptidase
MALPDIISVEDFFSSPVRASASISPDGTKIAYLAPWKDRLNVWVQSVDANDAPRRVTADDNRSVFIYRWSDDPRWLLYAQDGDGDENWHIYRVDLENPDAPAVDLTPFPGAKAMFELPGGLPGKAIVHLNQRKIELFDLYEIDIATGELTLLAENPGHVASWLCSRNGDLLATALTPDGDVELSRWDKDTGTPHTVVVFDGTDYPMSVYPMVITPDGTGVWIGSNRDTDRTRLVRLDLATGEEHRGGQPPDVRPRHALRWRVAAHPQSADRGIDRGAVSRRAPGDPPAGLAFRRRAGETGDTVQR